MRDGRALPFIAAHSVKAGSTSEYLDCVSLVVGGLRVRARVHQHREQLHRAGGGGRVVEGEAAVLQGIFNVLLTGIVVLEREMCAKYYIKTRSFA